ncbi:alkaline phosphatase [bacterium]|nr:alkaline phosphatase [bacterium]
MKKNPWAVILPILVLAALHTPSTAMAAPKNVILFVGDGMGFGSLTAARWFKRDLEQPGETKVENLVLHMDRLPHTAFSRTYSKNSITTDSAAAGSALLTGQKVLSGVISTQTAARGQAGSAIKTALEYAEEARKSTGVVTTTRFTHATPAACYAHIAERNKENDIARQFVNLAATGEPGKVEVIMGGGRRHLLPNDVAGIEGKNGKRTDGRNLIGELSTHGYAIAQTQAEFNAIDGAQTDYLACFFNSSHMQYEDDRAEDTAGEPSLAEMTSKAIDVLSQNKNGYFMMVEGGRIDHALHANNMHRVLMDTIAFDNAVKTAIDKTNAAETLIIVTSDHDHAFAFGGYASLDTPVLGSGGKDNDNLLVPMLGFGNGPGFYAHLQPVEGQPHTYKRVAYTEKQMLEKDFLQPAAVPLDSDTHGGADVFIFAGGPWADKFRGAMNNTDIGKIMINAFATPPSPQKWYYKR